MFSQSDYLVSYFNDNVVFFRDILTRWKVCILCLDKLVEAAVETRNELIESKEIQMRNIRLLAGALNGIANSNILPEI